MGYFEEHRDFFSRLLTALEAQFGPTCEIALHDYSRSLEASIVDIRNGHVTGRKIGDPSSNLGFELMRGSGSGGDRYNYITYLRSSRILKSSSVYLRDADNKVVGCLCINMDITDTIKFEEYLRQLNHYPISDGSESLSAEYFPETVTDLLDHMIAETQAIIGKQVDEMDKDDKIRFLNRLDKKGAFLISKSSEKVCSYLGISKFTFYKYLDSAAADSPKEKCEEPLNKE